MGKGIEDCIIATSTTIQDDGFRFENLSELTGLLGVEASEIIRTSSRSSTLTAVIQIRNKSGSTVREVYCPKGSLRDLQSSIHNGILLPKSRILDSSHGGIRGRSHATCVKAHKKNRFFYSIDLRQFFPNIHFSRVSSFFRRLGFSSESTALLTRLTTYNCCLAQGYITSPIIADQIFGDTDKHISEICDKYSITYTRYVDDLIFSAPFRMDRNCGIPKKIAQIIENAGYYISLKNKKPYGDFHSGDSVLGLRLHNSRLDVTSFYFRETVRRLEVMRNYCQDGQIHREYFTKDELHGRVQYVLAINPRRRRHLMPLWNKIDWESVSKMH